MRAAATPQLAGRPAPAARRTLPPPAAPPQTPHPPAAPPASHAFQINTSVVLPNRMAQWAHQVAPFRLASQLRLQVAIALAGVVPHQSRRAQAHAHVWHLAAQVACGSCQQQPQHKCGATAQLQQAAGYLRKAAAAARVVTNIASPAHAMSCTRPVVERGTRNDDRLICIATVQILTQFHVMGLHAAPTRPETAPWMLRHPNQGPRT